MADPIALLREFTMSKKEIAEMDDAVCFGDIAFLKATKTNHTIYGTGRDGQPKDYYTLEAILFMVKNAELGHATYTKAAHTKNMQVVKVPDRTGLLAYLKGEAAVCTNIDKSVPMPTSFRRSELLARAAANNQQLAHVAAGQQSQSAAGGVATGAVGSDQPQDSSISAVGDAPSGPTAPKKARLVEELDDERAAQERQRLAARLDLQNEPTELHADQLKNSSLSEAIPIEKIADIRAKRLAKKRQQIKEGIADELAGGVAGDVDGAQLGTTLGSIDKQLAGAAHTHVHAQSAIFAHDAAFNREILAHERRGRTRTTALQTHTTNSKSLFAQVEAILKLVKSKEDSKRNESLTANLPNPAVADNKKPAAPATYNRYDQERFATSRETAGFKINVVETFHGAPLRLSQPTGADIKAASEAAVAAADGNPQTQAQLLANIKPMLDSGGRIVAPTSSSRNAVDAKADLKAARNGGPVPQPQGAIAATKRQPKTPIIVIPATGSSLITMYNAEDVLGKLQYVSTEDKRAAGVRRENDVLIYRESRQAGAGGKVPIRVVDNPQKLSAEEWDRVVGVFVQGPLWQFKGWPYDGNPVDLFSRMKAFHLKWAEQPLDSNIKKWDVKVFELDRYKRHMDRAILQQFWETLDVFVIKHKPHLRY